MLKGLRQHTISKATRSNVQIKSFPGARLRDMKHYSIPPSSTTKPKNVILHIGTNDLHNKKPADIVKDARSYVTLQNTCPNSTISSIITINDDENGFKVFEVNNLLRQLFEKNTYRFMTHDNIDKRCLNRSAGLT